MASRTFVVFSAFFAALIAGILMRYMQSYQASGPVVVKEHFAQRSVGMPVDFNSPVQPIDGTSPILGSEAKPVSQKQYEVADDTQLFAFANAKVSAECCPSVFSTDSGCVCLSDTDKAAMYSRGGNRALGS
jgi:predicted cobalt transporter CbtA